MGMLISELKKQLEKDKSDKKEISERERLLHFDEFRGSLKYKDTNQEEIIDSPLDKFLVTGPAGSGKTIVCNLKVLQLEEAGDSYIIVIYTKALKKYLEGKLLNCDLHDIENKIFYADEFKGKKDSVIEEIKRMGVEYILIDEVQDLSIDEINSFTEIAKKGYFLFGDKSQQVYPDRTGSINVIDEIKKTHNIKNYNLTRTFRVPSKIAELAECIDKHKTNISKDCYFKSDEIPKVIQFNSLDEEMKYIIDVIINENWENVGILLKTNEEVYNAARCLNGLSKELKLNIQFEQKSDNYKKGTDNLNFSSSNPKIMTYHSAKGLEFDRVFIPFCRYDDNPTAYNYQEAFFVAITRAKETLIISYSHGRRSQFIDMFDKDKYLFEIK